MEAGPVDLEVKLAVADDGGQPEVCLRITVAGQSFGLLLPDDSVLSLVDRLTLCRQQGIALRALAALPIEAAH